MVGQIDRMMLLRKDNTDYRINFDPVTTFQVQVVERLLQVIFIGLHDHTSVISNRHRVVLLLDIFNTDADIFGLH